MIVGRKKNIIKRIICVPHKIFKHIYDTFRKSRTARVLLIIVIIKLSIFYGFFKSYWFPVHLKPEWESEQHRIDDVTKKLLSTPKNKNND